MKPKKLFKKFMKSYGLWDEYKERSYRELSTPEEYLNTFQWDVRRYTRRRKFWIVVNRQWLKHYNTYKLLGRILGTEVPKPDLVIMDEIT